MLSPKQANPKSSPKPGTVESAFKPKAYATGRCTPTSKTGYQTFNKASTLTVSASRGY